MGVGTEVGTGFREIRYRIYLPFNTVQCTYRGFSTLALETICIHNMYHMQCTTYTINVHLCS